MKQEYKLLLLKDLCARLPYGVKIMHNNNPKNPYAITAIRENDGIWGYTIEGHLGWFGIDETSRPYLRPLSSMSKEEHKEYKELYESIYYDPATITGVYFDWLNAHHFDYRGLIDKGLAFEAPKGMYNIKD